MDLTGLLDLALGAVKISLEAKKHNTWWSFLFAFLSFLLSSLSDCFNQQPNDQN